MNKIEYIFYNEAEIRELVAEAKQKVVASLVRNDSKFSDPTAASAIRNLTPIEYVILKERRIRAPEMWLEVIERTRSWCHEQGGNFYRVLRARYLQEKVTAVCRELGITGDTFYRTLDKIKNYAALWAAYFHLIRF